MSIARIPLRARAAPVNMFNSIICNERQAGSVRRAAGSSVILTEFRAEDKRSNGASEGREWREKCITVISANGNPVEPAASAAHTFSREVDP